MTGHLESEFMAARAALDRIGAARLGIPADLFRTFAVVGADRVLIDGPRYQPSTDGDPALIVAVRQADEWPASIDHPDPAGAVRCGEIADLVAVPISRPGEWALRTGAALWAGCADVQLIDPPPTEIWRNPLTWLRGGAVGICPLTRKRRELQSLLLQLQGGIIPEDIEHGRTLRAVMETPYPVPPILIHAKDAAA
jgi:hypothetical protein